MTAAARRRRRAPDELGFVVTPEEIANRVASIDRGVQLLDKQITASTAPTVNAPWRAEWAAFLRRWAVERDSYASWGSRLFATRIIPRLEQFESSYSWWAKDFQKRSGEVAKAPGMQQQTDLTASLIPNEVWYIAAGAAALIVLIKIK